MIKSLRVDDRLLHGQVIASWMKALSIDSILIASDSAAHDEIKAMSVRVAKPLNVKLYIKDMQDSIAAVEKAAGLPKNFMVIVENVPDALTLAKNCPSLKGMTVTVGGQKMAEGRRRVLDLVCVSDQDLADLQQIESLGVNVVFQKLAEDSAKQLKNILN